MVELAALEKRYGATHRGFESLSLRQNPITIIIGRVTEWLKVPVLKTGVR